ncbi:PREDICTED: uncharacterized protein LOC108557983 [Nicrophorus vespilloides]|uniref:Uncharacterized protein LOC108557983 n=1 Tax=Nicrophorus vespilloides TaxID=110193 RepID=A0ABM1M6N1_NICVS|nr:PREDICTED: uncharacterized protein LOC108557983 [Nicrophorus vespilloides]
MEHVRPEKYETVLSRIDDEYEQCQVLKEEVAKLKNQLKALKVLSDPNFAREKLFRVQVKLFSDILHIRDLYSDVPINEISTDAKENLYFYYVQVYILQLFHEKIVGQNWLIIASVRNQLKSTTKIISLKNTMKNPLTMLIPFEKTSDTCVDVFLVSPEDESDWPIMKITTKPINISYKFESVDTSLTKTILNINKIYNGQTKSESKQYFKYSMKSNWNRETFVERFLKNSYHKLNLVKVLNKNAEGVNLDVYAGNEKCLLEFESSGDLTIRCPSATTLYKLKKFFMDNTDIILKKHFHGDSQSLQIAKDELEEYIQFDNVNLNSFLKIYDQYVQFISNYPI